MKNVKQIFFLALLSCAAFSCSDATEDTSSTSVQTTTKAAESSSLSDGNGNLLYKIKSRNGIMYVGNVYNHSFNANVVSSTVTSTAGNITITSPVNESIKMTNTVRNNGKVTFNLTAYNSNNKSIKALTNITMDETGFDNLVSRNCTECADAMLIALVDFLTHDDSSSSIQQSVNASRNCEANGGIPKLSLEHGFFNNTSVFSCN